MRNSLYMGLEIDSRGLWYGYTLIQYGPTDGLLLPVCIYLIMTFLPSLAEMIDVLHFSFHIGESQGIFLSVDGLMLSFASIPLLYQVFTSRQDVFPRFVHRDKKSPARQVNLHGRN